VDTIVVGNFVGERALGAVGASSAISFLFIALAMGLSIGASVVISQYFGAKKLADMKSSISTILLFAGGLSALLSVIGVICNQWILTLMRIPEDMMDQASTYLSIYFAGLFFLFLYNALNAIYNALGSSIIPFFFLVLSSIVNIGLDLYFVIEFNMGVAGVAYATLIAQGLSAVLSFFVLISRIRKMKIGKRWKYFDINILKTIFRVAVPSIIQQSIVSLGVIFVQALVNGYGTIVVAGFTAATKIDMVAIVPMINIGNAVSNFTGQNMGAGKIERIRQGLKAGLIMSNVIAIIVTISLLIWGDIFIRGFVRSDSDPRVIEVGMSYLRVVGVCYILMGTMNIFNGILRGSGDMKGFMRCTLANFSTRVILSYLLVGLVGKEIIWYSVSVGWAVGLIYSFTRYRSGRWKEKKVI
jgi:putative MATE family efflux protein